MDTECEGGGLVDKTNIIGKKMYDTTKVCANNTRFSHKINGVT